MPALTFYRRIPLGSVKVCLLSRTVLFTRRNCSLCDEAKETLIKCGITFEEIDVSGDRILEMEFGQFVPVIEVDGQSIFQAGMDPAELRGLLS